MKRLIVTADDFGASAEVNQAVEQAYRNGVLTSASLMVTGAAADDAVRRARELEGLAVGLHLVLVDGAPALPEACVTRLVNGDGAFLRDPLEAGLRFYFSPRARSQLEAEIRAQFEAFAATGLTLDHVDAHHHMHMHPTVCDRLLEVGADYGMQALRVPDEPVLPALCGDAGERRRRGRQRLFLAPWTRRVRSRAGGQGVTTNDAVFGLYDSGAMDTEKLVRAVASLPPGVSEIYLHPATAKYGALDTPHPTSASPAEKEYRALIHPRVARAVKKFDIELATYSAL